MTSPTTTTSPGAPSAQSPVQQVPLSPVDGAGELESVEVEPSLVPARGELTAAWANRLGTVLWQLGYQPEQIDAQLEFARQAGLTEADLQSAHAALTRELALSHANDAWLPGTQVGQVPGSPGQGSPVPGTPGIPGIPGPGPGDGPTPPPGGQWPPQVPPPGQEPGTDPQLPQHPPTKPPTGQLPPGQTPPDHTPPDPDGDGPNLAPWLIGAGVLGAGVLGALAFRDGARNVRALRATAASFESGAMHQAGLQSIHDAQLGARFTGGIGTSDYLQVALPIVNRVGSGGRLTSVARGHLDQAELLASATALRHGAGDSVLIHEPLRRAVLEEIEGGRPLASVLDELDRSAAGARPVFDNPQLKRYAQQASIVERGGRLGSQQVTSGISSTRAQLGMDGREIVETGRSTRIDLLTASRNARLGSGSGFADGIGSIQGVNVSTLNPAMQARAIEASGIDQSLVDAIGLRGAYMQRWRERVSLGITEA
ncbi:MAG: hypothetical protein JWM86_1488 [Thermoleophilia bacterium]|nr:hypothetical protein [Thermoleophilia bacterium]